MQGVSSCLRLSLTPLPLMLALTLLSSISAAAAEDVAQISVQGSTLVFEPSQSYDSVVLSVRGPKQVYSASRIDGGKSFVWDVFDSHGKARPDGSYTFQLQVDPVIDSEALGLLAEARVKGNEAEVYQDLCDQGRIPEQPGLQSGTFTIADGVIIFADGSEEKSQPPAEAGRQERTDVLASDSPDKELIGGDLTVHNSLCVGNDCLHPEDFDHDTVRLKENNLRIHFDDTSNVGAFPDRDWRLEVNSNQNGGASYFSIVDATFGRHVLSLRADAPHNSVYVDQGGRLGLGTSTPVTDVHTVSGNTPTVRLDQTGAGGYAPQVWDVAGNEISFFIRDTSHGSALPFRIRAGADSDALVIGPDSNIGIGILSPNEDLHIRRGGVPVGVKLEDSFDGRNWSFKLSGSGFAINHDAEASTLLLRDNGEMRIGNDGAEEFVVRANGDTEIDGNLDVDGNISATGMISDRDRKQQVTEIDGADVLAKVLAMPVSTWVYDHQTDVRHIGPMAQDFHALFGLGTEVSIGLGDLGGLSLAAIQELSRQLETKDRQLRQLQAESEQLRAESAALQTRLEALEAALLSLQQN